MMKILRQDMGLVGGTEMKVGLLVLEGDILVEGEDSHNLIPLLEEDSMAERQWGGAVDREVWDQ